MIKEEKEVALPAVSWSEEMHFETTDLQRSEKKKAPLHSLNQGKTLRCFLSGNYVFFSGKL